MGRVLLKVLHTMRRVRAGAVIGADGAMSRVATLPGWYARQGCCGGSGSAVTWKPMSTGHGSCSGSRGAGTRCNPH
jgi:hypothetical protein